MAEKEGFLCPLCLKDCGEFSLLEQHFEECGLQKSSKFPIKNILGRAQKMMKPDFLKDFLDESTPHASTWKRDEEEANPQEIGCIRDQTAHFKKERDFKIDNFAVETNKLIIRLDKLMSDMPSDVTKRKTFEKETIPWLNDREAQNCSSCNARFSLTKRKHHCRLCGKILCSTCSAFLPFPYARKIINPAYAVAYNNEADNVASQKVEKPDSLSRKLSQAGAQMNLKGAEKMFFSGLSKLKTLDGSEVSVNSFFDKDGQEHLRICRRCETLLKRHDQLSEQRSSIPFVVQIYERLMSLLVEADRLFLALDEMATSLAAGESQFEFQAACDLRDKITVLESHINYVCGKLAALDPMKLPNIDQSKKCQESILIENVLRSTVTFLRDKNLTIQKVPAVEEYSKLRDEAIRRREQSILKEREYTPLPKMKTSASSDFLSHVTVSNRNIGRSTGDTGWVPSMGPVTTSLSSFALSCTMNDDPESKAVEEQMLCIKGYLKQATRDGRIDEARMLKRNLDELEQCLKEKMKMNSACDLE